MPIPKKGGAPVASPRDGGGIPRKGGAVPNEDYAPAPPEEDEGGVSAGALVGGAAAGGGLLALAAKLAKTSGVPGAIGKGAQLIDTLRKQLMLSGMALPKSLLGNVGAAGEASIERGTLAPLKAMLSKQTVRDFGTAYKDRTVTGLQHGMNLPGPVPGRIMGAADTAARNALQRGGLSAQQAENSILQSPLQENFGRFGDALEGPVAQYVQPFRRTPFNQMAEGHKRLTRFFDKSPTRQLASGENVGGLTAGEKRALGIYTGAGAAHGAATADDDLPLTIPLAVAASARHGLPYGLAAMVGRAAAGGKLPGSSIAGSVLPVSEWGLESSISDPLRPFRKPAAFTAIERMFGSQ